MSHPQIEMLLESKFPRIGSRRLGQKSKWQESIGKLVLAGN